MKFLMPVLFFGVLAWGSTNNDRVLLADMKAFTFYSDQMTTRRRNSPVSQLSCIGGTAGCYGSHQPHIVQCRNHGSNGMDAQWECNAVLGNKYQFGHIRVVCEGYDYPEDPYILKGSCGLEYELDYTAEGHRGNRFHARIRHHELMDPPKYLKDREKEMKEEGEEEDEEEEMMAPAQ